MLPTLNFTEPVIKPHPFYDRPVELSDDDYEDAVTDEELKEWQEQLASWQDDELLPKKAKSKINIPSILPSQFTEFAFRMPAPDGMGFENFTFEGRRHMRRIYDTPARRVLLICARQCEKSTALGNRALCYSCLIPAFKSLYVSPSATQTKTFSADRIKEPIETSPVLRAYTTQMLSQNVFEKQFVNRAKITLRYAFLNADRTRGLPAWALMIDELQDILQDNIPVIEQCTSHAPENWKTFIYAGTPKSLDNTIEWYRSSLSTQGEWVVPCDCQGGETGRYWNILGEKNIGKKGLICERCGSLIFPQRDEAQWANMIAEADFESYRIPQLMVPWRSWSEILLDYKRYPRDKFYNEVLGISFDSGMRPLTMADVKNACDERVSMHPSHLKSYQQKSTSQDIFAGIDWGGGGDSGNSYTVITLATYVENKFRVFYIHRFIGEDLDPNPQLEKIMDILRTFNVAVCGVDWGGGFYPSDTLVRKFGPHRIQKFQYMGRVKKKVDMEPKLRRFKVHRTEVMSDIFNAIKRRDIVLPRWEEFKEPYGQDLLNIFSEYNESLHMIQYDHSPGKPDDSFHSILYCFLASMLKVPRPDVIAPVKEDPTRGGLRGGYSGPVEQQ